MIKPNKLTRRRFIALGAAGLAVACDRKLQGLNSSGGVARTIATSSDGKTIITRVLGRTGLKIPIVSMGVMNASIPDLVRKSYESGIRYFDTAAVYQRGQNEMMVGRVINELKARDKVVIATKVLVPHDLRPKLSESELEKFFLDSTEKSLSRLQTDYIDILLVHDVLDTVFHNNQGIIRALETLKKRGLIRFTGLATHMNMDQCLEDAADKGFYDVILTAYNYSMYNSSAMKKALEKAAAAGIGLVAMKTQCTQAWYKSYLSQEFLSYYEGEVMHSAVLKWALRNKFIATAVPGYTSYDQMETDLTVAYNLEYTPEEKKFLESRQVKLAMESSCLQCAQCVNGCPKATDIPALMRVHMYAFGYKNTGEASRTLVGIKSDGSLENCYNCASCSARCIRRVDIPARISELKALMA